MLINDKNDIFGDISRSFHVYTPVEHFGEPQLNELAIQHPRTGCQTEQNVQTCYTAKNAKTWWLEENVRKLQTSKPVTDTVLVLSKQCILYERKRDKWSL